MTQETANQQDQTAIQKASYSGCRVLYADDCPANHHILKSALSRIGVEVTAVETGAEAVAAVRAHIYDLVFMDAIMPEMDGFEATARIRALEAEMRRAPIPIIALTAYAFSPAAATWRDAGMSDLLPKPFTLKSIRACLAKWIARPSDLSDTTSDGASTPRSEAEPSRAAARILELIDSSVLDAIRDVAPPEDKLLARVVALYIEHAPQYMQQLGQADPTDTRAVAEAAHALKSISRNLGVRRVGDLAGKIERSARSGTPYEPEILHALRADFAPTLDALAVLVSEEIRPHPAEQPLKPPSSVAEA